MNVLQILPELNAGGVERTTLEVAEALLREGHTAHIASNGGRLARELKDRGAILHTLKVGSKNPLRLRQNTKALIDIIKTHKIDIAHARSRAPAWPAYTAARACQIPFVTTYHGIYNAQSSLKRRYNSIMARGDVIIANSEYTKAHILKEHRSEASQIVVIPRGVDLSEFDPEKITLEQTASFRAAWNVQPAQKVILLPGRLTRWKGQEDAIQAFAKIKADAILVLMGDPQGRDAYVKELENTLEKTGLAARVRIVDHTSDMAGALSAADVVVSASTQPEAFGRVSIEAQAMGRPIVATAHGGSLETIMDGQTGYLVPPGDMDAFAGAISKALVWKTYDGQAARARICKEFSKERLQSSTLAVYRRVFDMQA